MSTSSAIAPPIPASTGLPAIHGPIKPGKSKTSKKDKVSPVLSLLAGGIAGGTEATATYPFEFAKTRAQLRSGHGGTSNPFSVIINTAKNHGIGGIYTGCSTLILGTAFKAGVRFLSFDSIKNQLADERGNLSPARGVLAGMLAGVTESIVAVTPTERIKTALIDDARNGTRSYRGGLHATKVILQRDGISGLYRGLASTTMKQAATSAVRMGSYNMLKGLSQDYGLATNSAVTFGMGAIAGTITVYATQPFDTIKTRAQSARGAGTVEAFRNVLSDAGLRGFWSGSTMRLGRLVFSGGIVFTVYEKIVQVLGSH
ncbi:mitochondrial carrier [Corynespora cassiicola Philippines]|uniref:Mitochondrial carrier n=1 Tax=Corynespora cassiicola Philippines TaxID=1448308 RepID=A0A2T2NTJ3_CORCC|nr:mitochondrial carrier [Corynespora cassiicola Philippines]